MYDYIIVGAGLYGSICAHELNKKGYKVLVLERRNHIAGNIYTENMHNIPVHKYGAHIFHTSNKMVWDYVNSFAPFHNFINSPIARYYNETYNLPFNMNTFSRLFNIVTPDEAKARIEEERKILNGKEPTNLEEQAISLVGTTIYKKLVEGYTAKQWGRDCKDLPPHIIRRLPVRFTYDNNYFNDIYQGIPTGGYTQIIERMLDGIEVRLNTDFLKNKEEYLKLGRKIIYTGAIDEFFEYCYGPLTYRSLRFEEEVVEKQNVQGNAVVNYTDPETPFTRIIEHKHFENDSTSPYSVITREYPASWEVGDEMYYPLNDETNKALYQKYLDKASSLKNVYFGGRLGLYQYYDMDDIIDVALKAIPSFED